MMQRRCVAGLSGDLEPGLGKHARETFTEKQGVFCDYDSHGISPKAINKLVWRYVDDMFGDMYVDVEEELRTERDEASDIC